MNWSFWAEMLIKGTVMALGVQGAVSYLVLAERRIASFMQDRIGPNRCGPFGLLQPLADAVKFFMKEDIVPANADRFLYVIAPGIAVFSAFATPGGDLISPLVLGGTMYLLFEATVFFIRRTGR